MIILAAVLSTPQAAFAGEYSIEGNDNSYGGSYGGGYGGGYQQPGRQQPRYMCPQGYYLGRHERGQVRCYPYQR